MATSLCQSNASIESRSASKPSECQSEGMTQHHEYEDFNRQVPERMAHLRLQDQHQQSSPFPLLQDSTAEQLPAIVAPGMWSLKLPTPHSEIAARQKQQTHFPALAKVYPETEPGEWTATEERVLISGVKWLRKHGHKSVNWQGRRLNKYGLLAAFVTWYSGERMRPARQIKAKLDDLRKTKPWLEYRLDMSDLTRTDAEYEFLDELLDAL